MRKDCNNIQEEHAQGVYVILNEETRRVKIGIAFNVRSRFSGLITSSGCKLKLMYYTERTVEARKIEKKAHEHFAKYRYIGEWFNIKWEDAADYIRELLYRLSNLKVQNEDNIIKDNRVETIKQPRIIQYPKKVKETWYGNNERVLDISLGKFKRIDKEIYKNKRGELFKIVYRNRQWLISNL